MDQPRVHEGSAQSSAAPCPFYAQGACGRTTERRQVLSGGWPAPSLSWETRQEPCAYPLHSYVALHGSPMLFAHPKQAEHQQLQASCGLRGLAPN